MAREKAKTTEQPNPEELAGTEPSADTEMAPAHTPAGNPAGAVVSPAARTRDRDPADREAWKRERARQLGYHR